MADEQTVSASGVLPDAALVSTPGIGDGRARAKKRRENDPNRQQRMLVLDVHCADDPEDVRYTAVRDSLKHYRAVARQMFGTCFCAYAAGCEIQDVPGAFRVLPKNAAASAILDQLFGKTGKMPLYSMRDWVRQEALGLDWLSYVWDSLRAVTWERWSAKDPEFPKASRGYLALNGARKLAQCAFIGLQCPILSARPKFEERSITVKFRESLGPIQFDLNKLDGGRWRTWIAIRDGHYKAGTVTITERDGFLRLLVPYSLPTKRHENDPARIAKITWNQDAPEKVMVAQVDKDILPLDAAGAMSVIRRLKAQMRHYNAAKEATGAKSRPWGFKKAFVAEQDRISRLTARREAVQKDWNHAWTRRIADWAVKQRVAKLVLEDMPSGGDAIEKKKQDALVKATPDKDAVKTGSKKITGLCGEPWAWSQFKSCLKYKLEFFGVELVDAALETKKKDTL